MIPIPPELVNSLAAGITYTLKGWCKNKTDPELSKFNWTLFTKNIVIGFILGALAYYLFPGTPLAEITGYPIFYVLQSFVDKLIYKVFV